jgi:E3 ubiquitin-protein ligase HUWE1
VNVYFRNLVTLHIRVSLLSDVFTHAGYSHGRGALGLLQTLMGSSSPAIVADLGSIHGAFVWENIVLKAGLGQRGIDVSITPPATTPVVQSPGHVTPAPPELDRGTPALPEVGPTAIPTALPSEFSSGQASTATGAAPKGPDLPCLRERNGMALKHLTHGIPMMLGPFFQSGFDV